MQTWWSKDTYVVSAVYFVIFCPPAFTGPWSSWGTTRPLFAFQLDTVQMRIRSSPLSRPVTPGPSRTAGEDASCSRGRLGADWEQTGSRPRGRPGSHRRRSTASHLDPRRPRLRLVKSHQSRRYFNEDRNLLKKSHVQVLPFKSVETQRFTGGLHYGFTFKTEQTSWDLCRVMTVTLRRFGSDTQLFLFCCSGISVLCIRWW